MKTHIVLGLGFGDEGKGLTTAYLCQKAGNAIVIRFNGGHQAGHTVVLPDGKRHVFSSLGSGSLHHVPTYWSRYCTFYPLGFLNEYRTLLKAGAQPRFYLDALSPVTTYYDVIYNRALESNRDRHGSCGLGFGATIERHESFPKLFAQDLWFPAILEMKLKSIAQYYDQKIKLAGSAQLAAAYYDYDFAHATEQYMQAVKKCISVIERVHEEPYFAYLKEQDATFIFEGAQGILLDMDHGFFPHVTRSHTTSKNALELIQHNQLPTPSLYYVTRAYQTRHGAGPMTNEDLSLQLRNNENETNVLNDWQGNFRTAVLDIDLLQYALLSDTNYSGLLTKNLVITCLDQVGDAIPATRRGVLNHYSVRELANETLPTARELLLSKSEISENIQVHRLKEGINDKLACLLI